MIYNEAIKDRFLNDNEFSEGTAIGYKRIFKFSADTEEKLDKDLYEFNRKEIRSVLWNLNPPTENAAQSYGRIITSYIRWAIKNGFRSNNDNPLQHVRAEYFNQFIDKHRKPYFNEKQLRTIENNLVNAQDRVVLRLLFEGVNGKQFSEIRNLDKNHINFSEGMLTLINDKNERREINVSERTMKLIREAINQEYYEVNNGEGLSESARTTSVKKLADNDYVIRGANTNLKNSDAPVSQMAIYGKVKNVAKWLLGVDEINDAVKYFTPKNIQRSGAIYYAKQLLDEYGELNTKQLQMVSQRFMINTMHQVKAVVTTEAIKELYGDKGDTDS